MAIKRLSLISVVFAILAAAWAFAQQEHMQHTGMVMAKATGVKVELHEDAAAKTLTVRVGPLNLPAHTSHHMAAQAPDQYFAIPFDGWLTGYYPRITDESGRALPGRLLHHVAFYNTARSDFLCPAKPEHIFGAGGEMSNWLPISGLGYRVLKGDRVRVSTMFHNETDTNYPNVYLEVKMNYQRASAVIPASSVVPAKPVLREGGGAGTHSPPSDALKNVYPAWFDVKECGNSSFDLNPGKNLRTGEFKLAYSGRLIGVGGHLHDYGHELVLEDSSKNAKLATLDAKLTPEGQLLSIPVVLFTSQGGYPLLSGETLKVTALYDNPTGKFLPESAMGIVVGYFLPDDDSQFARLRR
jgi:hypothetical protein